jgi:hypothetical protein
MKPELIIFLECCKYVGYFVRNIANGTNKRQAKMRLAQAKIDARNAQEPAYDIWQGTSADFDISVRG